MSQTNECGGQQSRGAALSFGAGDMNEGHLPVWVAQLIQESYHASQVGAGRGWRMIPDTLVVDKTQQPVKRLCVG